MRSSIKCTLRGNFKKTNSFLERCLNFIKLGRLDEWGKYGVAKLIENTPVNTGRLASSWYYKIKHEPSGARLIFCNDDIEGGENIAILVYYGHGTRNGVYVQGIDYITPAMVPVIEYVAESIREEIEIL